MEKEDHRKFFDDIRGIVSNRFAEDCKVPPLIYAINGDQLNFYYIATLENEEHKDALEKLMVKLVEEGADAICFVTESWMLDQDSMHTMRNYSSIAENPNRMEALVMIYSAKGFEIMGLARILREEVDPWSARLSELESKPTLGEWDVVDSSGGFAGGGRFGHLWEKARAKHYQEN